MDKSIAAQESVDPDSAQYGFAHALLAGLSGTQPKAEDLRLASQYWAQHFESPWADYQDAQNAGRLTDFLHTLGEMGRQGQLLARWNKVLTSDSATPEQYRGFVRDFMQSILHHPRNYHDFVCQRQTLKPDHPMDIAIQHPLAVEYWTIYLTKTGCGQLLMNGKKLKLHEASVLVMPPGRSGTVQRIPSSSTWTFDMLSIRSSADWLELLDWALATDGAATVALNDNAARGHIDSVYYQLEHTPYQRGDLAERLCFNLIEQLLIQLRIHCPAAADRQSLDPRLRDRVDFLLSNYSEKLDLEGIAKRVHLSSSRLNALFRKEFGCSVLSWRENIRLQKARELLNASTFRISAIANAVGYDDPLYFSRKFRQRFGVSPRQLRAR